MSTGLWVVYFVCTFVCAVMWTTNEYKSYSRSEDRGFNAAAGWFIGLMWPLVLPCVVNMYISRYFATAEQRRSEKLRAKEQKLRAKEQEIAEQRARIEELEEEVGMLSR